MPRKKSSKPFSIKQTCEKLIQGMEEFLAGNDPGVISFQTKRPNGSKQTYPLRLTQQQRESLIHCTRIKNRIKVRFQEAGEGTQTVLVTLNELDHLNDEHGQASVYAPHPDKKRLVDLCL